MTTIITAVVAAGNFETVEDARAFAAALETVAAECYPGATISVDVRERQTNGGVVRVEIDGDDDETAAIHLHDAAERRAF